MHGDPNREPAVPDDMRFQARSWRVERTAWAVMAVLVLLGLAGVFASGPLSDVSVRSADGAVTVDYPRFARKTARAHFDVRISSPGPTRIRFGPSLLASYDIEALKPHPLQERASALGLELDFAAPVGDRLVVAIAARARRFGVATFTVDVESHGQVRFWQVIYP